MKNISKAIILGWIVTIYIAVLILRNSMHVYNIFFLLVLSAIFNVTLANYEVNEKTNFFPKAKKSRKK